MNKNHLQIENIKRILIICEGSEEYDYIEKLRQINTSWSKKIKLVLKNAKGIDRIFPIYQYELQDNNYYLIFIVCDTEIPPYEQFKKLKSNIDKKIYGFNASKHVVFFANPCSMQIILSHFDEVKLTTNNKNKNSKLIKDLTGVEEYDGSDKKRTPIFNKLTILNYKYMKETIKKISSLEEDVPSSNILDLFDGLDYDTDNWLKTIHKKLDK